MCKELEELIKLGVAEGGPKEKPKEGSKERQKSKEK